MRSIRQIKNLKDKVVLLRADFNVPIKKGKVLDDFRIKAALPTIKFLLKKGAKKIILITHLGKDGTQKLTPVINSFFKISKLPKTKFEFLDNIRKFKGEEKNDLSFAKDLAKKVDPTLSGRAGIYVNDAFSVSHRKHASIVTLPKLLPAYAGLQLEEEVKNLSHALKPKHPFLFILGGAKFSTKMPLVKKFLKLADYVFIGGALANDFLKAEGYIIGKSLVGDTKDESLRKILKNKKIILPTDVKVKHGKAILNKLVEEVSMDEYILDIGDETLKKLTPVIKNSKLILWNGPLGKYEDGGAEGTKKILKLIASSKAESIIGGGDTVALISELKLEKKFFFVSTGGGSTLDFLSSGTLPGIKVLGK